MKTRAILDGAVRELRHFSVIFLYLWALLSLHALNNSIILAEPIFGLAQSRALVNALVLAKVMFVGERYQLADMFAHKPFAYAIVFKAAVFAILLISFEIFEKWLAGIWHGKGLGDSFPDITGRGMSGTILVSTMLFVVLLPFFAVKELARQIGDSKLYEVFFISRAYVPMQS